MLCNHVSHWPQHEGMAWEAGRIILSYHQTILYHLESSCSAFCPFGCLELNCSVTGCTSIVPWYCSHSKMQLSSCNAAGSISCCHVSTTWAIPEWLISPDNATPAALLLLHVQSVPLMHSSRMQAHPHVQCCHVCMGPAIQYGVCFGC